MKVYFVGAHSTGKTTLARYVSEKYNLTLLNEVARAVLAEKELNIDSLRSNLDVVDSYQFEIFHRQILEEKKNDNFVSDRNVIDYLAYSAQHARIAHSLTSDKNFIDHIANLNNNKTIIFFVRPSKATMKYDGVREQLNWDGIVSIDAMIKLLLEIYNIKYFVINTDSMQERIKFVDSAISFLL